MSGEQLRNVATRGIAHKLRQWRTSLTGTSAITASFVAPSTLQPAAS